MNRLFAEIHSAPAFSGYAETPDGIFMVSGYVPTEKEMLLEAVLHLAPEKGKTFRHGSPMSRREQLLEHLCNPEPTLGLQRVLLNGTWESDSVEGRSVFYNPYNRPRIDVLPHVERYGLTAQDCFVFERYTVGFHSRLPQPLRCVQISCSVPGVFSPLKRRKAVALACPHSETLVFCSPFTQSCHRLSFQAFRQNCFAEDLQLLSLDYTIDPPLQPGYALWIAALDENGEFWENPMLAAPQRSGAAQTVVLGLTKQVPPRVTVELAGVWDNRSRSRTVKLWEKEAADD
ncbi:MAG: hypothetical protein ACOX6U_01070 [Oscillospiraceae bacterium]